MFHTVTRFAAVSWQGVRGQTKKGEDIMYDLDSKINFSVFPGLQVGVEQQHMSATRCQDHLKLAMSFLLSDDV